MKTEKLKEFDKIRSRLVNISLIVACVAGLPLLCTSLYRAIEVGVYSFFYVHIPIYLTILIVTIFRKRLSYLIRAYTLIGLVFLIGAFDFVNVGFLSAGFLSFTVATIVSALYFDMWRGLWVMGLSIFYISIIYILNRIGIITYTINYNDYASMPVTAIMLSLNIVLYGLIVSFSIAHIQKNQFLIIKSLKTKSENLEETTKKLHAEVIERSISEQKAIDSEKNFRNIFEKSSEALLVVGNDRSILDYNEAYIQMSGINENKIFLLNYESFLPEEDIERYLHYFDNLDTFPSKLELSIETPNGQKFLECSTSIINYFGKKAVLFMIRDSTERKDQEKKNYLTAIEAEEKERLRFSKELHDGLGPLLSTLKIYLEVFFTNPNDAEIRERIESTLTESIKSVKEISNNISPYILENMGLVKAVSSFVEKIKFGKKLEIDFHSNLSFRLKPEIEISIYRFTTELINNTLKHAQASKININIEETDKKLEIHYSDNGIGFNIEDVSLNSKGIGLYNLRSRIEKLGGRIEMNAAPGEGFSILATLKIDHKQE
jgi:PAS domain S-box-containing protein